MKIIALPLFIVLCAVYSEADDGSITVAVNVSVPVPNLTYTASQLLNAAFGLVTDVKADVNGLLSGLLYDLRRVISTGGVDLTNLINVALPAILRELGKAINALLALIDISTSFASAIVPNLLAFVQEVENLRVQILLNVVNVIQPVLGYSLASGSVPVDDIKQALVQITQVLEAALNQAIGRGLILLGNVKTLGQKAIYNVISAQISLTNALKSVLTRKIESLVNDLVYSYNITVDQIHVSVNQILNITGNLLAVVRQDLSTIVNAEPSVKQTVSSDLRLRLNGLKLQNGYVRDFLKQQLSNVSGDVAEVINALITATQNIDVSIDLESDTSFALYAQTYQMYG